MKIIHRRAAIAASAVLAALGMAGAGAQSAQSVKDAYVQDARGAIVRSGGFGDPRSGDRCWRTGQWTPAQAIAECDPDIAPRPAAKPRDAR